VLRQQTDREGIPQEPPRLEVIIEFPPGSFLKRISTEQMYVVPPFPCSFNYGSIEKLVGLEGDLLDVVAPGARLGRGTRETVQGLGATGMTDRGRYNGKLICSHHQVG